MKRRRRRRRREVTYRCAAKSKLPRTKANDITGSSLFGISATKLARQKEEQSRSGFSHASSMIHSREGSAPLGDWAKRPAAGERGHRAGETTRRTMPLHRGGRRIAASSASFLSSACRRPAEGVAYGGGGGGHGSPAFLRDKIQWYCARLHRLHRRRASAPRKTPCHLEK